MRIAPHLLFAVDHAAHSLAGLPDDTTVHLVFDAALVLSVYLLFAGHNQPGGGFIGGLVAVTVWITAKSN